MTAVDTNIIIRFLVRDDEKQSQLVYKKLKEVEKTCSQLFIPLVVVLEAIWVLESAYGLSRDDILDSFEIMRQMPIFVFDKGSVVDHIISEGRRTKLDLSDLLIAFSAQSSDCNTVLTFDKKASRLFLFKLLK